MACIPATLQVVASNSTRHCSRHLSSYFSSPCWGTASNYRWSHATSRKIRIFINFLTQYFSVLFLVSVLYLCQSQLFHEWITVLKPQVYVASLNKVTFSSQKVLLKCIFPDFFQRKTFSNLRLCNKRTEKNHIGYHLLNTSYMLGSLLSPFCTAAC